jgi:hypothetical protein
MNLTSWNKSFEKVTQFKNLLNRFDTGAHKTLLKLNSNLIEFSNECFYPKGVWNSNDINSAFGKSLCTYKRLWKWCPRASLRAWTRLTLFANTFCISSFGKSLWTYKKCWKWCPRASIQAWTRLILFANCFCRSAFGKSLCTYKRRWKWFPRTSTLAT